MGFAVAHFITNVVICSNVNCQLSMFWKPISLTRTLHSLCGFVDELWVYNCSIVIEKGINVKLNLPKIFVTVLYVRSIPKSTLQSMSPLCSKWLVRVRIDASRNVLFGYTCVCVCVCTILFCFWLAGWHKRLILVAILGTLNWVKVMWSL